MKSKAVPSVINGRRRPQGETQRSLIAPASGCITIATIRPVNVSSPRAVFFRFSGTIVNRTAGRMITCRLFHMNDRLNIYAWSTRIWTTERRRVGMAMVILLLDQFLAATAIGDNRAVSLD